MHRVLKVLIIALCLLIGPVHGGSSPKKARDLKALREEIQRRREAAEKRAKEERRVLKALQATAQRAGKIEGELQALRIRYKELSVQIEELQREVAALERKALEVRERLRRRLRGLYRLGRTSLLELLLSSRGYGEMLRRLRFLSLVIEADRRLLEESRRLIEQREEKWHILREKQRLLSERGREIEEKRRLLKEEEAKKRRLLAAIRKERQRELRRIAELQRRERALRELIEGLRGKPGARKGMARLQGRLPLPVKGKALKLPRRKGIAFFARRDAEVRAVYDGRVAFASWFDGYGNLMIIDHGHGFHTIYAHASRLLKGVGEEVKAGEVIALVGDTGSADRPMLYFEIRYRGRCQDPSKWLALPKGR